MKLANNKSHSNNEKLRREIFTKLYNYHKEGKYKNITVGRVIEWIGHRYEEGSIEEELLRMHQDEIIQLDNSETIGLETGIKLLIFHYPVSRKQVPEDEEYIKKIKQLEKRLKELESFQNQALSHNGVFISYSHTDAELVDLIESRFKSDRINYWRDDKDLYAGQIIDKAISNGIQQNWLFLIILTPSSIKSKWVEREFDEASHEEIEGKK